MNYSMDYYSGNIRTYRIQSRDEDSDGSRLIQNPLLSAVMEDGSEGKRHLLGEDNRGISERKIRQEIKSSKQGAQLWDSVSVADNREQIKENYPGINGESDTQNHYYIIQEVLHCFNMTII